MLARWFMPTWWRYLLRPSEDWSVSRWTAIRCRMRGHPEGPWFYNIGGSEPDWHCKNCGDDIG